MNNDNTAGSVELTTVQVASPLSNFLAIQALSGTKKVSKRKFLHDVILDGLKARNITIPPEIMNTR